MESGRRNVLSGGCLVTSQRGRHESFLQGSHHQQGALWWSPGYTRLRRYWDWGYRQRFHLLSDLDTLWLFSKRNWWKQQRRKGAELRCRGCCSLKLDPDEYQYECRCERWLMLESIQQTAFCLNLWRTQIQRTSCGVHRRLTARLVTYWFRRVEQVLRSWSRFKSFRHLDTEINSHLFSCSTPTPFTSKPTTTCSCWAHVMSDILTSVLG